MKTKICSSWLSRAVGLMFSSRKRAVMVFDNERIVPLHTFFVFFTIKVQFLDRRKRIVEKTVMRPFSFYTPKGKAQYVVEEPLAVKR